jgi:hypothetical protein
MSPKLAKHIGIDKEDGVAKVSIKIIPPSHAGPASQSATQP